MKKRLWCVGLIGYLLVGTVLVSHVEAKDIKKIFILHSYEKEHVCGQPQHDGVIASLEESGYANGENVLIGSYYMDTKKANNTPELIAEQAVIARERIEQFGPDVLVTLDDNAFRTVALDLLDADMQIVFCGLNGQPETYNEKKHFMESRAVPNGVVSGVYEHLHIIDSFRVHKKIFPELKKVRMIVDTSPTGKAIKEQIERELADSQTAVDWDLVVVKTWEEYQENIIQASNDNDIGAIYPIALLLKDANGATFTAPQIFAWTVEQSTKPEIALNYAFTDLGLFGGAAVDFFAMGEQAGKMVVKALDGLPVGNVPIEDAKRYALAFNLQRANELDISIPDEILLAADKIVK